MTETRCVVVDVMRAGPSTGQPTKTSQQDVMQAKWGSHENVIVILDPEMIQEDPADRAKRVYRVPVSHISENLGKPIVASVAMVGAITGLTNMVDTTSIETTISEYAPRGTEELNFESFKNGREYAQRLLQEQTLPAAERKESNLQEYLNRVVK